MLHNLENRKVKFKLILVTTTAMGLLMGTGAVLAAGGGSVYLTQTGNSHAATIDQSGGTSDTVGSYSTPFQQQNGSGSGGNFLVINQNTAGTSELPNVGAFIGSGSKNAVTGYQYGTANNAEIDQGGSNSSVNLQQSGKGNGLTANAGWFNNSYGNLILQDWTANYSSVSLTQTNNVNATRGNVFSIGQGGYNNNITADQTGRNSLWVRQGTTAPDLWSWTHGNPFDPANTGYSLATLSNSSITVHQSVGGNDPSSGNYAALGQGNGSGNAITVTQNGAANAADVNQVGGSNTFVSTQTSGDGNVGWNFVGGEAGWPGANANPLVSSNGDFQPITQIGSGNQYFSTQSGTDLWAFGSQIGDNNFLSNTQSGDQNALYTGQLGDSNSIYAVQSGTLNLATVSQHHSGSTASFTQTGPSNTATINQ